MNNPKNTIILAVLLLAASVALHAVEPAKRQTKRELYEGTPLQALLWGDWRAVRNGPSRPIEIYNLKADAAESKNLAAENPGLVAKAESLMKAARVDDPNWPMPQISKSNQNQTK